MAGSALPQVNVEAGRGSAVAIRSRQDLESIRQSSSCDDNCDDRAPSGAHRPQMRERK